ncbi:MAG: acetylglutamate kinase [Alphaproteobacteria bacterium]|nr:acetylglutamate kinase [Alphaproteobacteria bacterium]
MNAKMPPSLTDIETLANAAWRVIPERLRRYAADVVIRVEDFPDDEICRDMELESSFDLLGLYQGVALNERSVMDSGGTVDMVFLYRRPILDYWCEHEEDLAHLVRHVLIHEIGHHFGFSDADMEALEREVGDMGD